MERISTPLLNAPYGLGVVYGLYIVVSNAGDDTLVVLTYSPAGTTSDVPFVAARDLGGARFIAAGP